MNFSLISYNTRGLRDTNKRIKIFDFLKSKQKQGIIMLQETHSVAEDLERWQNELGYKTFLNSFV